MKEEIIHEQIMALSPKFREVILLRDVQQLSYEEISQIVNIPLGTVKSRVNRGRLKLQEKLKELLERKNELYFSALLLKKVAIQQIQILIKN